MAILAPINSNTNNQSTSPADAINDIDMGTFLKLMIVELQNQDPLNPLENKDMLAQISQIRAVGASDQLTKTLNSVLLGQNITSATNLLGADVTALTEKGEAVAGIVSRVAVDKGVPKLHLENAPGLLPSVADGNIEAGTYSYKIVWDSEDGKTLGMEFSGDTAITTTGTPGVDNAIQVQGLPATVGPKFVYRTDKTGGGRYQLVGVIADGDMGSIIDNTADAERGTEALTESFQKVSTTKRTYDIPLANVSKIRPPAY